MIISRAELGRDLFIRDYVLNMQICILGLDSTLTEYREWNWKQFTRISITGAKQERACCQFHASVRFNILFYQSKYILGEFY